ncbi:hydrolase, NUDIX domain containing protein [Acanthamoeba castellanii str. Neff]|uniref:NAD(+) diphosphatase n=1 Tax=Acanthamoeba castellanii (strain ATCC 30010 / Neff) TaxID=1257118 RepID=L8HFQ7_ACACF|nr:hydrolase, NUDIX domain containing protein [Acanthamoeba castellanii str. Neff]ELR23985.1 hydrolase, NUDIX domain containing protein [Acanthamoeba castellanii str. Neff]
MEDQTSASPYEISITFSGNPLDRVNNRRKDVAFLATQLESAASVCIPFHRLSPLLLRSSDESATPTREIRWKSLSEVTRLAGGVGEVVLLGLRNDTAHYAVELPGESAKALTDGDESAEFIDMRRVSPFLIHEEAGILAQARALLEWHAKHKYCGVCGSPTRSIEGGSKRQCTNAAPPKTDAVPATGGPKGCGNREYPRTNPVVIMLVIHPDGRQCLLGTQNRVSGLTNMWSCLAGFMDPGETIEEAVRREVWEESGIEVGKVEYFASQPWPFGTELMIGCFAHALKAEINVDRREIADARWFTPAEIENGVRQMAENPRLMWASAEWRIPAKSAIAHQLMAKWVASLPPPPATSTSSL